MSPRIRSFDGTEWVSGRLHAPRRRAEVDAILAGGGPCIPRGAGLSYCNASAGSGVRSLGTEHLDRILDFDASEGRVLVEPGVSVGELLRFAAARGWRPPVVPGHPLITVGGCVGFNVHGRNQHLRGNFIRCVERLDLLHPDHGSVTCGPDLEPEIFALTLGGFGLTGFVAAVELRLEPLTGRSVRLRRHRTENLVEAVETMEASADSSDAVYSWHDLNRRGERFGRGVVYVERSCADPGPDLPSRRVRGTRGPALPVSVWNRATTGTVTRLHGWTESLRPCESVLDLHAAAFPIQEKWLYYRLFGRRGLREYQMLVPRAEWKSVVEHVEMLLERTRVPVTLGSLKLFRGKTTFLNFCGDGVCFTLDVPATDRALDLFAELDALVLSVRGIVNVAKDSRLSAATASRLFPEYEEFRAAQRAWDPHRRFDSALRRRILD